MIHLVLLCAAGLTASFLLIRHVPSCPPAPPNVEMSLSIVIPARNEESNLLRLLQSIAVSAIQPSEILVVDDGSTDSTARIAQTLGATVVKSLPLPAGWIGKSWACHQAAQHALGDHLLFLDADTFFVGGGLERLISRWPREGAPGLVLSMLPYHAMDDTYEQLSLFFNILMAAGAGGFGPVSKPRLFGQSLLISKETYFAVGGYAAVRSAILENFSLAQLVRSSGVRILCLGGRGTLHMRMFPDGASQMSDSWTKSFAQGAAQSEAVILMSAVVWISALWSTALLLVVPRGSSLLGPAFAYLLLSLHLVWIARQLGNYRLLTCLLYPLPLGYYCAVFGRSALRRALHRKTVWRGREV